MKVLLTGFDPFGGETVNPALEAVKLLDGAVIAEAQVVRGNCLPYAVRRLRRLCGPFRKCSQRW